MEQKQRMDLRKRKCLAAVERVCSILIITLISTQVVLACVTLVAKLNHDHSMDCSMEQQFISLIVGTHIVLFVAMVATLVFILRIRMCSYDYSHINTNNVTIVLVVYLMSYIVRAV